MVKQIMLCEEWEKKSEVGEIQLLNGSCLDHTAGCHRHRHVQSLNSVLR